MDETKRGRDLGAYLRQRVAQAFREGENTQVTGGEEVGDVGVRAGEGGGSAHASASLPGCTCARYPSSCS